MCLVRLNRLNYKTSAGTNTKNNSAYAPSSLRHLVGTAEGIRVLDPSCSHVAGQAGLADYYASDTLTSPGRRREVRQFEAGCGRESTRRPNSALGDSEECREQ